MNKCEKPCKNFFLVQESSPLSTVTVLMGQLLVQPEACQNDADKSDQVQYAISTQ